MQVTQCHFKFYLNCLDSGGNKDFKLKSVLILKVTIKALCLCGEKIPECSPGLWLEKKTAQKRGFAILSTHRKNHSFSKSFCWGFLSTFNVFPPALKTRKDVFKHHE